MLVKIVAAIFACLQLRSVVNGFGFENWDKNVAINSSRRILNGRPANIFDFPFLVGLRLGDGTVCAGSIIDDQWILSAGHCIFGKYCNAIAISAAVWRSGESVYPVRCFPHPQYTPGSYKYDISLLRVEENLLGDGRARTIPLPQPGARYPAGTPAVIAGWGKTEENFYPDILLQADLAVEDWYSCNEKFKQSLVGCPGNPDCTGIPNRVVCTIGQGYPPSGSCFGDSGGPVVIHGCVAGVVSFLLKDGNNRCRIGTPSMHVNVADYLPWIYSIVRPDIDISGIPVNPEY